MRRFSIKILTGLSGSGKSTALDAFEDAGFYCVDNMPVALLPKFLEIPVETAAGINGLVFVMDLRESDFLTRYPVIFEQLRQKGYALEILFFEAGENVLIQRYSQTRRHHPLAGDKGLLESIRTEKELLRQLRQASDQIIDTSGFTIHELKHFIYNQLQHIPGTPTRIHVLSFGFKFGIPHDADMIMDVRFLPNPYFVPEMKNLDGKSEKVNNYVLGHQNGVVFMNKFLELLDFLIPLYKQEPRAYFTIAIGCTGGRHRSVAIALAVFDHLSATEEHIEITHRDIWQE